MRYAKAAPQPSTSIRAFPHFNYVRPTNDNFFQQPPNILRLPRFVPSLRTHPRSNCYFPSIARLSAEGKVMASIDRYRPPREGYQPPSLPQGTRQDRASRSPAGSQGQRREVPPAVPTPPQHSSSRTSPPTSSQARRDTQNSSPSRSADINVASLPGAGNNQWFFTSEEVSSTPTIVDGVVPSEERLRRAKGVNFVYQAGVMLDLPKITLWVAGVFFHRFFMRYSMVQEKGGIHHYVGFVSR
jgi:hypothetical protein